MLLQVLPEGVVDPSVFKPFVSLDREAFDVPLFSQVWQHLVLVAHVVAPHSEEQINRFVLVGPVFELPLLA